MREEADNPYIADQVPGSWDVPFRRWGLGACLPIILFLLGVEDMATRVCEVPLPAGGRFSGRGIAWMELKGAGAVWFGLLQFGAAVALHGRYHWRYHPLRSRIWEAIQNVGLGLAAVATVFTLALLWKAHF